MIPIFTALNRKGKIIIQDKDKFDLYLSLLPENVHVKVFKPSKIRSMPQNRYYWSVCVKMISDFTGYDESETHELLKVKFNSKTINVGNDEVTIACSTASLKTMEFEAYISKIVMFASMELGLVIPNPYQVEA
jgi:hypothetical protein